MCLVLVAGFPDISVGKESACNVGDPSSISWLGRSAGKGIGYPLQYFWASLVAQLVKNLPAIRDTWVGKIPWRREQLPTPYSDLENSMHCIVHGVTKSRTQLSDFHLVLVAACGIFSCGSQTLSCGMWDLVPWLGTEHRSPALRAWSFNHWTTRKDPSTDTLTHVSVWSKANMDILQW